MNYNKVVELFKNTLNMEEGQVAELVKEGEELKENWVDLYEERLGDKFTSIIDIEKAKADKKAENYFSKGVSEVKNEIKYKYIKPIVDKFGLEGSIEDSEQLIEALEANLKVSNESKEVNVKAHPDFIAYQQEMSEEIERLKLDNENKLKEFQSNIEKEKINSVVEKEALKIWDQYEFIKNPDNPQVLSNQREEFLRRVTTGNYSVIDGVLVPLNGEGERLVDALQKPVAFEDLARKNVVNYVPIAKSKPRTSGQGGGTSDFKGHIPESREELMKVLAEMQKNGTPAAEQIKLKKAFDNKV